MRRDSSRSDKDQLAESLLRGRARPTLLLFHSRACQLCASASRELQRVADSEGAWLEVSRCAVDDPGAFAPEMLHYSIDTVPAFVLLRPGGDAIAKSGRPLGEPHVARTLGALVALARRHR